MEKQLNGSPKSNALSYNPEDHIELCQIIAATIYKKYNLKLLTYEDLVSHGYFGLIRACELFNPETINSKEPLKDGKPHYVKFSHYAGYWIQYYIKEAIKVNERNNKTVNMEGDFAIFNDKLNIHDLKSEIKFLLSKLTEKERKVIIDYYYRYKTHVDIGKELYLTGQAVGLIKFKALQRMLIHSKSL